MKVKILITIALSIPTFLFALLAGSQPLGKPSLTTADCQLKKWYLPFKGNSPVLRSRSGISCCQKDVSCLDEQLWGEKGDKKALITSINRSLQYLQTQRAVKDYQDYSVPEFTRDRVVASLLRFRQLVQNTQSPIELHNAITQEFDIYQSIGSDKKGGVLYTSYYEPIYTASRVPTAEFRYPIYRIPPDIKQWQRPHPTRLELEGADGLQAEKTKLKGLAFFWLRDRLEPYMMQIQGSAQLQLTDGSRTSVGYAGNSAHDYSSIGKALADDGKVPLVGMTMPKILEYFHKYPLELNTYIPRDKSFVFFQENKGSPATGSIQVGLTPDRSIATDKSLMPPGALALIRSYLPFPDPSGAMQHRVVSRYVLDQDTGGAIKGAGRVDYFTGSGKVAGERAGVTVGHGQLFYLLLKPQKSVNR
ncbi:murein transglycosylase A [Calothrix sp. PCC 6303]|uniref:murein transglycosylase A n=1 Tax=Calothrix sp. PCC 6303 TaxID=1170562 RepID=UPI0005A2B583|nr:MltA domain-containing protein [Calothrix sp. PCC 6303]